MKVVFVYTSLKLYWIPRLVALQQYLEGKRIGFTVIEIAGNSTIYGKDDQNPGRFPWWKCIFPDRSVNDIPIRTVAQATYQVLTDECPDVLISGSIPFPCGATSIRWANDHKKRILIFDDVKTKNVRRSPLVNFIKQLIYNRVDGYIAPSESYYSDLKFWKFKPAEIFPGLNCIDNAAFERKSPEAVQQFRFKSNIDPSDTRYLICVARLVPIKNHKGLLSAWKKCMEQLPASNWKLLIAGDGPMKMELRQFVHDQQIANVTFLDALSQEELPYYYSIASGAVLPSFEETWGLVINEAMAAGLPVVVSNQCNCIDDLVKEGINGFACNPFSVDEISAALLRLLNHPDLEAMGAASKQIISRYSLAFFCENVGKAIEEVSKRAIKKPGIAADLLINVWKGRFQLNG